MLVIFCMFSFFKNPHIEKLKVISLPVLYNNRSLWERRVLKLTDIIESRSYLLLVLLVFVYVEISKNDQPDPLTCSSLDSCTSPNNWFAPVTNDAISQGFPSTQEMCGGLECLSLSHTHSHRVLFTSQESTSYQVRSSHNFPSVTRQVGISCQLSDSMFVIK